MKHYARRLKVKDNINTDYVISGRYKFKIQDPKELAKHIFEDLDPEFAARVTFPVTVSVALLTLLSVRKKLVASEETNRLPDTEKLPPNLRAAPPVGLTVISVIVPPVWPLIV